MRFLSFCLLLLASCSVPQAESMRAVAAYDILLPMEEEKAAFLDLLESVAETHGYHVDAATPSELERISLSYPISINASIWRGEDDEEKIATILSAPDAVDHIWIIFPKGENPELSTNFRNTLVARIEEVWPQTTSLPIAPTGAIPHLRDMVLTPAGYEIKPEEMQKYQLPVDR